LGLTGTKFGCGVALCGACTIHIDATFQSGFTVSSPNNPAADANGNVQVQPGNHLPGIPTNLITPGADCRLTDAWTIGGTGIAASGRNLFGDEANLTPKTPAYFVLNLHTSYQLTPNPQLFGLLQNAFNTTFIHSAPLADFLGVYRAGPGRCQPAQPQPRRSDRRHSRRPCDVLVLFLGVYHQCA
jgi:outer membrane receptor protein involved in Fe transport